MKVITETQGDQAWFDARKGKITASDARYALAGKHTKGRRNYIESLADDLEGLPDFGDEENPPWFAKGRYYESFARGWYCWNADIEVIETGFVEHDEYTWLGCSPDGLVGDDGLVEIKFREFLRTFKQHTNGSLSTVLPQIQTQMLVCDRQWCDYVNYWRDEANEIEQGHIKRIFRDDSYIENTLLPGFVALWNDVQALLKQRGVR